MLSRRYSTIALMPMSSLILMAIKRATSVVKLVISNLLLRQSINETDHEGNTPLHLAAMSRNWEIIHLLLSYSRVDTNVINRKGLTPLDIASSCVNSNIRLRMMKLQPLVINQTLYNGTVLNIYLQKKMLEEFTSVGSKFGTHRMDILMVLIATITVTAAFTLPGGYNSDDSNQGQGMAILAKKLAFKVFLISDTILMLSSISVTCLLICTSSLDHDIRLHSIIIAIKFMWVAVLGGMLVAFSMGIYVVVVSKCRWLAVLICGMVACVPFIACMTSCRPTFGSIKLVQNDRNQKSIERKTSIFKVNIHMPHWMVVDFVTPASSREPPI
ncbi:hypothetical protein IEQ34_001882 [Dendrobium chrysotoxum]|uniref:PGG domain-containing protein n=1 Tax=Dendrobium chrysotoxum TaxID=161865 RepID=A0AAV7HMW9_DENCH|nr:hypothetical protein IEQ34_001882 [Dendrobium chrysotoxum]